MPWNLANDGSLAAIALERKYRDALGHAVTRAALVMLGSGDGSAAMREADEQIAPVVGMADVIDRLA
jgi:hypothetical protein